jgi:hypothetical protein
MSLSPPPEQAIFSTPNNLEEPKPGRQKTGQGNQSRGHNDAVFEFFETILPAQILAGHN